MSQYRQFCALARSAELIGERWTLLIIRELLLGPKRFVDLSRGLVGIGPSVLTQRLNRLEEAGIAARSMLPPPAGVAVYGLTPTGEALRPAVLELIRWGGRFLFPLRRNEKMNPAWMRIALEAWAREGPSANRTFALRTVDGAGEMKVFVSGGRRGTRVSDSSEEPPDATVAGSPQALFGLISGVLPPDAAIKSGDLEVTGDAAALRELPLLFDAPKPPPETLRADARTRGASAAGGRRRRAEGGLRSGRGTR